MSALSSASRMCGLVWSARENAGKAWACRLSRWIAPGLASGSQLSGEAYVQEALSWLPEARPGAIHLDSLQAQALPAFSRADQTRPHILLADDNADMRAYLERLLANHYDVTAVADGESALRSEIGR